MKTMTLILSLLLLTACARPIPPAIHQRLDREFSGKAMDSGWKFIKITHGWGGKELVADILVTAPLPGTPTAQQQALRGKVCPDPMQEDLWKQLQDYKLSVAAYTQDRKFTVLVDCQNPYAPTSPAGN